MKNILTLKNLSDFLVDIPYVPCGKNEDYDNHLNKITLDFLTEEFGQLSPDGASWTITIRELVGLRYAFGENITAHLLTTPILNLINETDIQNIPFECPNFLKTPFLLESKNAIFDNIYAIGGHWEPDDPKRLSLFGLEKKNNVSQIISTYIEPTWNGRDIESLERKIYNENAKGNKIISEFVKQCSKFLIIFSLLIDAVDTPAEIIRNKKREKALGKTTGKKTISLNGKWSFSTIYISQKYEQLEHFYTYENTGSGKIKDNPNLVYDNVRIRGFLRRQPCGKNRQDTKYIYIAPHYAFKKIKPDNKKITVK